jgi:hypothetical protein
MELPDDILAVVRDFSRPCTRPDWRTLKRWEEERFLWNIFAIYNSKRIPVIEKFVADSFFDSYYSKRYSSNYYCVFRAGFVVQLYKIEPY